MWSHPPVDRCAIPHRPALHSLLPPLGGIGAGGEGMGSNTTKIRKSRNNRPFLCLLCLFVAIPPVQWASPHSSPLLPPNGGRRGAAEWTGEARLKRPTAVPCSHASESGTGSEGEPAPTTPTCRGRP